MNCLWIILLLTCFGGGGCGCGRNMADGCGCNMGGGCDNDNGCDRGGQRSRCRRAVENAVNECGSEKAVMRAMKDRDSDCGGRSERSERAEAREERMERRAERMADNDNCDVPGMKPPHWQDFPEVSRPASRDDCGCDS